MTTWTPRSHNDYTVGWIYSVPMEMPVARLVPDEIHPPLPRSPKDQNTYVLGSIAGYGIAITFPRSGEYDLRASTEVARDLMSSFPSVRFIVFVGIGGGIPSSDRDIRLGDVVIAEPSEWSGRVIQYDLDKVLDDDRFVQRRKLTRPLRFLRTAVEELKAMHKMVENRVAEFIVEMEYTSIAFKAHESYLRPPKEEDCLYRADYNHVGPISDRCVSCDGSKIIPRPPRDLDDLRKPAVHFGPIASLNSVLKDGKLRDQLAQDSGVCCVETGAAGLMSEFPCLVIRGISDYADSHKNRRWQGYAAAAATAYAKELLLRISHDAIIGAPTARETESLLDTHVADNIHRPSIAPSGSESSFPMWLDDFIPRSNYTDPPMLSRDSEYPSVSACSSFGGMDEVGPTMLSTDSGYGSTTYNTSAGVDEVSSAAPRIDSLNPFLFLNNELDWLNAVGSFVPQPDSRETFDSGYCELGLGDETNLAMPPADYRDAFNSTYNTFGGLYPYIHGGMDEVSSTILPEDSTYSSYNASDGADLVSSTIPYTNSGDASIAHDKIATDTMLPRRQDRRSSRHDFQSLVLEDGGLVPFHGKYSLQNAEEEINEATLSIYTEEQGTSPHKQQIYISHLSDDLFSNVRLARPTDEILERIHNVLPRLLKGFALRLGHSGSTQMHRDVMIFIRRYRHDIASTLRLKYTESQGGSSVPANGDYRMGLNDRMKLWYHTQERANNELQNEQNEADTGLEISGKVSVEDGDENIPEIAIYRKFISNSPAYKWLLGSIQREIALSPADPNAQDAIRAQILESIPLTWTMGRHDKPKIYQTTFTINWNPVAFVREQGYDQDNDGYLGKMITITGSRIDAQAMTSLQYIHQTWHSYGAQIIQIVEATLISEQGCEYICTFPDKTQVGAWIDGTKFFAKVTGTNESIAEIGEQLAWLASALRSSLHDSKLSYCTPFIRSTTVESISIPTQQASLITKASCEIDFWLEAGEDDSPPSVGQCWHHLFRNPIVVKGFPIARRSRHGTGLEIPLNLLAALVHAENAEIFNGKIFIKGFSTVLLPTEYMRDEDQITWHLLYNAKGERISYLDGIEGHAKNITLSALATSRHILGWCLDAKCYAGSSEAGYSIERSRLRSPSSRCSFSNTVISAGKPITGGDEVIYGNKDVPFRIARSGYFEKLYWINKQYVVMWDVGAKRGWLVNGACALLHLLLASIHSNRTDSLCSVFRLDMASIRGPKKSFTPHSAMEVLLNPDNLCLELYDAQEGEPGEAMIPAVRIRHRVDRLYSMLEKMMDHQAEVMRGGSDELWDMPRGNLEGWDFKDLATNEDPLYPRHCKLRTKAKGWVDLARAIRAITLFGSGFGEIIQPVPTSDSCPHWSKLPEGKSYLAISDGDLANIIDRYGDPTSSPYTTMRISTSHIACTIQKEDTKATQAKSSSSERWGSGAVVFGYNRDLPWSWSDTGFPVHEETFTSSDDSEPEDFPDSGLGTSMVHPTTNDGNSEETPLLGSQPDGLTHGDYEVGIVCALSKELFAVRALFDLPHPDLEKDENDPNCYCLGRIKKFNVVAAGLPHDDYGTNSATNVASHLIRTFPRVKFCLLVGIGGGVPSTTQDIRLGDIVVGTGVIQVDMGKLISDSEFQRTGEKQKPPSSLRAVITKIQSDCFVSFSSASNPLLDDLSLIASRRQEYEYPGADRDTLFISDYLHPKGQLDCHDCTVVKQRQDRLHKGPHVFYGLIASGNQVVRDASHRDRLSKENVICLEMEAAGVVRTTTDCLVIRGICDYSDSHKNKLWQEYAAATAAAYAKFFLSHMPDSGNASIRVPSHLEPPMGPLHLQKQKRPAQAEEYQPSAFKRVRRD
ncbi:purine and uridine phosphorylase [Penicillium frequentans]|uniref:Purine and uridine phosphorylase n=1 Tax=Penicillium frequentans TaxID=3151616 RepID=A0AAD6CVT9_9EURO|nr:purine and uridine phosphorylase [Penicillium glabrum]